MTENQIAEIFSPKNQMSENHMAEINLAEKVKRQKNL